MKVQNVKIKNYKGIDRQDVTIDGNNVYVMGGNAKGKSSFIDAIFCQMNAEESLKQGERRGEVIVDYGELKAQFKFDTKNGKPQLTLLDEQGNKLPRAKTHLDQVLGKSQFDINDFLRKSANERIKDLKQIAGINTDELDKAVAEAKDDVSLGNREIKAKKAIVDDLEFDRDKTDEIDIADLSNCIEAAIKNNTKYEGIVSRNNERLAKIDRLNSDIEELERERDGLIEEKDLAQDWISDPLNILMDYSGLKSKLATATEHNQTVAQTKKCIELINDLDMIEDSNDKNKQVVADLQEQRNDYIAQNPFPVNGLKLEDDELFYKNLPLESDQINTAELIIIGLQMQHALSKDIKIARFDGSVLDKDNMELVENWAAKNDMQLFVELVDRENSGLKIEVREA